MRVRRRHPCLIQIGDALTPDFHALLRGEMRLNAAPRIELLCPVTARRIPLSADEVRLLAALTAHDWHEVDALAAAGPLDADAIVALAARDALISDADTPQAELLRDGEARLEASAGIRWRRCITR